MKLTLLLISLVFLASCTGGIASQIQETKNQEIQRAKLNTYLKDVARYEASVRTIEQAKNIDDSGTQYIVYTGTLSWKSCGLSEEGADCMPPRYTMVMRDGVIIWFDEGVDGPQCTTLDTIENTGAIEYIRTSQCVQSGSGSTQATGSIETSTATILTPANNL